MRGTCLYTQLRFREVTFELSNFCTRNLWLSFEHTVWQSVFTGEWEISAFDGSMKSRGMSLQYTVLTCEREDLLVDREIDEDDISDYIDSLGLGPRGLRPQNGTVLLRVCKKVPVNNSTQPVNASALNATEERRCYLKKVPFTPPGREDANVTSGERIPEDILEEIDIDGEMTEAPNGTGGERAVRQRRQAEKNGTHSGEEGREDGMEIPEQTVGNGTNTTFTAEKNRTEEEPEEGNEISLSSTPARNQVTSTVQPVTSEEMVPNYIPSVAEKLKPVQQQSHNLTGNELSIEYDDYTQEVLLRKRVCL